MTLGQHIRTLRGLRSQEEFAEIVGVGRVNLSRWETDKALPSLSSARRLVELGLDASLLLQAQRPTKAATTAEDAA